MKSEVEKRRAQIGEQLDRLRRRLALKPGARYVSEGAYEYQRRRAAQLVAELEDELSMLICPGEYAELAVATVADELGLTCKQVRSLIKSGEIEAAGTVAHERVSRAEMARIAALGSTELLRLGRQEAAAIFQEAVPHLQAGDVELSEGAYRRLKERGAASAPAFLLCLEIAKGEFEDARDSLRLMQECADPCEREATMTCVCRLLSGMRHKTDEARVFCEWIIAGAARGAPRRKGASWSTQERPNDWLEGLQRRAAYLLAAVRLEMHKRGLYLKGNRAEADVEEQDEEFNILLRSAIYTALHAEETYQESEASRTYFVEVQSVMPTSCAPAVLLGPVVSKRRGNKR